MAIQNLLGHKSLLVCVVLYTALITWLSTARIFLPISVDVQGSDKLGHFLAYTVFALLLFLLFFYSHKLNQKFGKSIWNASLIGCLYGILMEVCQAVFTDYRSPDWKDIIANTSGIIFAVLLLRIVRNRLIALKAKLFTDR